MSRIETTNLESMFLFPDVTAHSCSLEIRPVCVWVRGKAETLHTERLLFILLSLHFFGYRIQSRTGVGL